MLCEWLNNDHKNHKNYGLYVNNRFPELWSIVHQFMKRDTKLHMYTDVLLIIWLILVYGNLLSDMCEKKSKEN